MAASASMIAEVRRMTAEPTETTYTDELMAEIIERYPLVDVVGEPPTFIFNRTVTDNTLWTATYDLNMAASVIWEEKAAALAEKAMDFSADGANYSAQQLVDNAHKMSRMYRSRRSVRTLTQRPEPYTEQMDPWDSDLHN